MSCRSGPTSPRQLCVRLVRRAGDLIGHEQGFFCCPGTQVMSTPPGCFPTVTVFTTVSLEVSMTLTVLDIPLVT